MDSIEKVRKKLYSAIDIGDKKKVLTLSRRLDKLILEFIKKKSSDIVLPGKCEILSK